MTKLPRYGEFELAWALNDPVNYLVGDGDLQSALEAMGANLAADGLLVFDCNTLMLFRASFEPDAGLVRDPAGAGRDAARAAGSTKPKSPARGSPPTSTGSAITRCPRCSGRC